MAFPQVESLTPTSPASGTSHLVSMPATVNAGDLLLAITANDGGGRTTATPSGWNVLFNTGNQGGGATTDGAAIGAWYRIAVGDEGGTTVDFVTNATEQFAAQVYRISGWHGTTAPEVGIATIGADGAANPPSLSPTWGAEDTLWIAAFGQDTWTGPNVTGYPSNYTNGTQTNSSASGAGSCLIASARRELNASSEDPGTFTSTLDTEEWVANTIAIRPAGGGSPPPSTGANFPRWRSVRR